MLNCKKNLWLAFIASAFSFTSCVEHKVLFNFDDHVKASFFRNIPGIGSTDYLTNNVVTKATALQIYTSSFSEKFIEKDQLLEFTELNDSTKIPYVDYWEVSGYSQKMYLMKYQFTVRSKSNSNARVHPVDAMLFFTARFKNDACIGFGPSYFGVIDYSFGYINFSTELKTKFNKNEFFLKPVKKFKIGGGYLFLTSGLFPDDTENDLNIYKIVKLDINKVGSYKPLVFDIKKILLDPNALLFSYTDSLNLTP